MKVVTDATKQATEATKDLGEASQEASSKGKVFADVKNVVTGMVPGLKAAEGGVNSFSASLKALLANPVILVITGIVATLKFIYEAFQSNVKIGKEIAAVWAGISAVGKQITDAIFGMARSFGYAAEAAYKFITLDFEGASKAMKKANEEASGSFDQLTNAVNGTTFAIVRGLEKQQQANNKAKKEQAVRESEINKLLVQSREILTDETASIKEKKKALEEVTKAEKASAAEKVRTAKVDLDILEKKAKALGGQAEKKMKQEIRDATIALNEAETENAMTGIKLNKQRKMLARQEAADAKEAADAAKERHKEYLEKQKEQQKAREESLKKIKDAEKEYQNSLLTQQQRELNDATNKYDELIKLAIKNKQDTAILEEAKQKTISDINSKYAKLELEEKAKLEAAKKALEAKQIADMKSADEAAWNEEKARMESLVKKQALERVSPETALIGGGGLKLLQTAGRNLASKIAKNRGLNDYVVPKLTGPSASSKTPALPSPTPRLPYDKAGAMSKKRADRAEARDVEMKRGNAKNYGIDPDAPGSASALDSLRRNIGDGEFAMRKGGKVKAKAKTTYKSGGSVSSASKRADGCAIRGKTRA
jgi:hypothetical protein